MTSDSKIASALSPEDLLQAYSLGYFPMAESRQATDVYWVLPEWRGVLPLDGFHLPRSLKKTVKQDIFTVTTDRCFERVMHHCAEAMPGREDSWINDRIITTYCQLKEMGFAHSVECWQGDELVGGLYGVHIGGAFFGESMFSRQTNASKVALAHLVGRLIAGGFTLLDTQFYTDHLGQFGVVEIAKSSYQILLDEALKRSGHFDKLGDQVSGSIILQPITQTS
ncbi:MAG: leucyl/phenylalanyl-tRNA--protein transferase [bacterium]